MVAGHCLCFLFIIASYIRSNGDYRRRADGPIRPTAGADGLRPVPGGRLFTHVPSQQPLADISVIHGGQNTVMNACLSGTPIVGVGMHPEQQANLDACVRKGFAIRLSKKRVTASAVLDAIDELLHDTKAKEKVAKFQHELMKWDAPANAVKFLCETFGS